VAAVQVRRRHTEADRTLVREREAAVRAKVVPFVVHDEAARAPHYFFSIESLPKNLLAVCLGPLVGLSGLSGLGLSGYRAVGVQDFFRLFFFTKKAFFGFCFLFFFRKPHSFRAHFWAKKVLSYQVS
jgi:hypothetical protein